MNEKTHRYRFLFMVFFVFIFFKPGDSFASSLIAEFFPDRMAITSIDFNFLVFKTQSTHDLLDEMSDKANDLPVGSVLFPGSLAATMCDMRRLFCGKLGLVMIAGVIFVMGILVLTHNLRWPYAVLMVVVVTIFVNPQNMTKSIIQGMLTGNTLDFMADACPCIKL